MNENLVNQQMLGVDNKSRLTEKVVFMDTEKRYYVYEWYNKENGHVFYVGKGTGARACKVSAASRNDYFVRYYSKYDCAYRIVADNLDEQGAYILENEIYQKRKINGECECNIADTSACKGGGRLCGELNGMYGKTHTDMVKERLHIINSDGRNKGENNTQYGVSPKERMDEKTYCEWRKKQRSRKDGYKNPNSHLVIMINVENKSYRVFDCVVDCVDYLYNNVEIIRERYNTKEKIRYAVKHSSKTQAIYFGYAFIISKQKDINIDDTVSSFSGREIRFIPKYYRQNKEDVTTTEIIDAEKHNIE